MAISRLFADTSFWLALCLKGDADHVCAVAWQEWIDSGPTRVVTTEAVLWETLNGLAAVATRSVAATVYAKCHSAAEISVVPFEREMVGAAVDLYAARKDKDWSLTDCYSFAVMEQRGMSEALTADKHFEQAGFIPLLRERPPSL